MPKRVGYLYERMLDKEAIRSCIITGSRGKRKRKDVIEVLSDVDGYTDKVYKLLTTETYVPTTRARSGSSTNPAVKNEI